MAQDITSAQIGQPVPMAFGYVLATGNQFIDYTDPNGVMYGGWLLSDDEWDGFDAFWNTSTGLGSKVDLWGYNYSAGTYGGAGAFADPPVIHFHSGSDTPPGTSITPTSSGPDQGCDSLLAGIPVVVPMCYSGFAYYMVSWLPETARNSPQLAPIGVWRSTRCRIFDGDGNQTSYGFTTNPAWHFVHAILKRKIRPRSEYNIDPVTGPDPLSAADKAFFDWGSIYESAQYYDEALANGQHRFSGSYAFSAQATLQAVLEQILLCCRSYQQEYAGKIYLNCDKPRSSVFLLTSQHLVPFTMAVDQKQVHANADLYTANFLDLDVPAVCDVSSISAGGGPSFVATINTVQKNPCAQYDLIRIGGNSNPALNSQRYLVQSATDYTVTAAEGYEISGTGTGGVLGYEQMRFAKRSPYIEHQQAAQAAGQVSAPVIGKKNFKKVSVDLDFANCTFDQANRLLKYEIYRDLGLDQSPWSPPVQITLEAWADSVDTSWNILKQAKCGDRITLDASATQEFAGDYEIIEKWHYQFQGDASQLSSSLQQDGVPTGRAGLASSTDQNSGYIQLLLRTYSEDVFFDVSDVPAQSYSTVPDDDLWSGPGPVNSGYQVISDTLSASDAGTSETVAYSDVVVRPGGHADLRYADGSITNQPYSTKLYLYVDDPLLKGGSIALQATDNAGLLSGHLGRMFIDTITTGAHGGGGTGGDGGGGSGIPPCFVMGTLIATSDGLIPNTVLFDRWKGKSGIRVQSRAGCEQILAAEWVRVEETVCVRAYQSEPVECSTYTTFLRYVADAGAGSRLGWVPARELLVGTSIEMRGYWKTLCEVEIIRRRTLVLHLTLCGPSHEYMAGRDGYWSHNTLKT